MDETARYQQCPDAQRLDGLQHAFGTRRQAQAFGIDAVEHAGVQALEQRHAAPQAFVEVGDLATHRGFGDGGDLGLEAAEVGDLVDALDRDQRRVHVHRHQPEVRQLASGRDHGPVDRARAAEIVERIAQRRRQRRAFLGGGHGVAARHQFGGAGEGADGVEVGGGKRGGALEDQGHDKRGSGARLKAGELGGNAEKTLL
ncbi:hypothetical protein D9M70_459180 [compost metagenome]